MTSIEIGASARAVPFLNCPRCGLSIRPKARWVTIEHCPRCLAHARVAVEMFASPSGGRAVSPRRGAPCRSAGCSHRQPERFEMRTESVADPSGAGKASSSLIRFLPSARPGSEPLRIAILAPPWIPVPPPGYGGIEAVVDLLCEGLVGRGHEVTLFAAPGSRSAARVYPLLEDAHPDQIGSSLYESDHVAGAWEQIDCAPSGVGFDVLHDHSGFTALAMAVRVAVPVVHTVHGAFDRDTVQFYRRHGHKALLVAFSRTQAGSAPAGVRIGRWSQPGRRRPLAAAHREAGLPAVDRADGPGEGRAPRDRGGAAGGADAGAGRAGAAWAGGLFREQVEPHLDGRRVRYVGEVAGVVKQELYANAAALLMPVRWREPFGMVMVEALACGTPVIAFPEGAAAEIVIDGENGMLVADEAEMACAVARLDLIDPRRCRASVAERYAPARTAASYERVYRQAIEARRRRGDPSPARRQLAGRTVPAQSARTS